MNGEAVPIAKLTPRGYTIATDAAEADGTFAWDGTHIVIVEIEAGGTAARLPSR